MKKSICSLLLLSLAFTPSAYGWGARNGETAPDEMKSGGVNNPNIHLHGDDENGYLKLSYLTFKPNLDDTSFTTLVSNPFGVSGADGSLKPKSPHFDWSSGVRLSLGKYLPHYDFWDIGFTTTYYYSDADNEVSAPSGFTTAYLAPQLYQGVLGDFSQKADAHWRMNFFLYDLGLAREYFLTPKITARPSLGVRGMALYQKFSSHYTSSFVDSAGALANQNVDTKLSSRQETWGVGLRAATDLTFELPAHFSIFGNIGGSFLYGHFKNTQNYTGLVRPGLGAYNPKLSHHGYDLQSSIEGSFGLKWERWYPSNNNRVSLSACFEAQQWFDINKLDRVDVTSLTVTTSSLVTVGLPNATDLHGDLTLVGFTFALQWDF